MSKDGWSHVLKVRGPRGSSPTWDFRKIYPGGRDRWDFTFSKKVLDSEVETLDTEQEMAKKVVKKRSQVKSTVVKSAQVVHHVPDDFLVFLAVGVLVLGGGMWLLGLIR